MAMRLITVKYPDRHNWHEVYQWCEDNCVGETYGGHDWENWVVGENNRIVQFEAESDAIAFALRWS